MTIVRPPVRFGEVKIRGDLVTSFKEKPYSTSGWINGGFFVLNYKIFEFIKNDFSVFEKEPLEKIQKKVNYLPLNTKVFGNVWIL